MERHHFDGKRRDRRVSKGLFGPILLGRSRSSLRIRYHQLKDKLCPPRRRSLGDITSTRHKGTGTRPPPAMANGPWVWPWIFLTGRHPDLPRPGLNKSGT